MHIAFDTENLSETDKQVLAVLAGGAAPTTTTINVTGDGADVADKAAAAAARVAAATKTTPAKKAAAAPAPDPEPEEVADEPTEEAEGVTLEDAKARAMDLVANGGAPKVKAALKVVGAAKVTEMSEDMVPAFMAALDEA